MTPQLDDITKLIDGFYAAAFDDALWVPALREVSSILRLRNAALGWQDFRTGSMHLLHGDCSDEHQQLFLELSDRNPFRAWMVHQQVGSTFTEAQFLDRAAFERLEFYAEWMKPQNNVSALVTRLAASPTTGGYLMLGGSELFDADAIRFMDMLAPTLSRVVDLRARAGLADLSRRSETFERLGLGLFVVNRDGRVLFANDAAGQIAASGLGVGVIRGRLTVTAASEQLRLRHLIQSAAPQILVAGCEGGDMIASCPETGAPACAVSVRPVPDAAAYGLDAARAAMVVLQPVGGNLRPGFEESVRSMFGLSPKEAELAAALAGGRSLKQAAAFRHISMATARTQLAAIFKKTNTTQQSQLVALLLGILPVAH